MATEKNAAAQSEAKVVNNILESGNKGQNLLALKPKSSVQVGFLYRGSQDLRALIGFVGSRPTINEDGDIQYKKEVIKENSVIFRTDFGTIDRVLTVEQCNTAFDLQGAKSYGPEYAAQVKPREVKQRVKKEKK